MSFSLFEMSECDKSSTALSKPPRRAATSTRGSLPFLALLLLVLPACGSSGPYVWYNTLPQSEWSQPRQYVIKPGDVISIRVWEQDQFTTRAKIRSDGRIELPFVGEVEVAGKQPFAVTRELEQRLKEFIVAPKATVNVEESQPVTITVMGEVGQRGSHSLQPPAELAQAIAQSGGLTEFASESHIYLLRRYPTFQRIRFTYDAIVQNRGGAAMFPLRSGDVIVVE